MINPTDHFRLENVNYGFEMKILKFLQIQLIYNLKFLQVMHKNSIHKIFSVNGQYNNRINVLNFLKSTMQSETETIKQK